jgi:hypothetical protein
MVSRTGIAPHKALGILLTTAALAISCRAASKGPWQAHQDRPPKVLPNCFLSAVAKIKAKSSVPILLPSAQPEPIAKAKYATVNQALQGKYMISLYFELGIGDAGFAGLFSAEANPKYHPQELGNVREIKLSPGIRGFFRPVSCGGSCAPANLWWEQDGVLYQIQLDLSPDLSENNQEKAMADTADSAISAGPR